MNPIASVLLSVLMAGTAGVHIAWNNATDVRDHEGVAMTDAAFSGSTVAVVWNEDIGLHRVNLGISISNDGGDSFAGTRFIPFARDGSVAICGNEINIAFVRNIGEGTWVVERAVVDIEGNGLRIQRVATGSRIGSDPDIACADGRVLISWSGRRHGGAARRYVATSLTSTGVFDERFDLGLDSGQKAAHRLSIAASDDMAYATYSDDDGKIHLRRWAIGAAPDHKVAALVSQVIGQGTPRNETDRPVIAAQENTVVVAWEKCAGTVVRISNNAGASWEGVHSLVLPNCRATVDGGSAPTAIAIHGRRINVTVQTFGIAALRSTYLFRTRNDFEQFLRNGISSHANDAVGFVVHHGFLTLANMFDDGGSVRFRTEYRVVPGCG